MPDFKASPPAKGASIDDASTKGEAGPDLADANRAKVDSAVKVGADIEQPAKDDDLLARAQLKAPSLTAEFVDKHNLSDEDLEDIASGLVPPPPYNGPIYATELHRTPGGWVNGPLGVPLEDIGKGKGR